MVKFKVTASLIVTGTLNVPPSVCNGTSVRPLASSLASGYKRNRLAARSNTAIPMTICNAFLWGGHSSRLLRRRISRWSLRPRRADRRYLPQRSSGFEVPYKPQPRRFCNHWPHQSTCWRCQLHTRTPRRRTISACAGDTSPSAQRF